MRRAGPAGLDMIRCFIFRRFEKHLPNLARKRRRGIATAARRFGSFWHGATGSRELEFPVVQATIDSSLRSE